MKKIKRKNLLIVLIAAVMVLTVLVPYNAQAAGKTKLNVMKKTICIGESYTVKILNNTKKVKWSATNKNIKITNKNNKQAKIKGIKKGTSYLKAKVGNKTYKCKVTVSAKTKLNVTSKTICIGDSATVNILNANSKVSWSTTNSCIKITKKANSYAKIKGMSKGVAYLKAKVGGKTYKCKVNVQDISKKITILAEYTLPDGIGWYTRHFVVVKNNSNSTVDISTNSLAYSKGGRILSAADSSLYALGPGCTSIFYEAFETSEEIDHYNMGLTAEPSKYYKSVIKELSYTKSSVENGAIFQVKNKGKYAAEFVEGYALFFLNGELVDYETAYFVDDDYEIKPGKTIAKQMTTYRNFDRVEFYLTGRR